MVWLVYPSLKVLRFSPELGMVGWFGLLNSNEPLCLQSHYHYPLPIIIMSSVAVFEGTRMVDGGSCGLLTRC